MSQSFNRILNFMHQLHTAGSRKSTSLFILLVVILAGCEISPDFSTENNMEAQGIAVEPTGSLNPQSLETIVVDIFINHDYADFNYLIGELRDATGTQILATATEDIGFGDTSVQFIFPNQVFDPGTKYRIYVKSYFNNTTARWLGPNESTKNWYYPGESSSTGGDFWFTVRKSGGSGFDQYCYSRGPGELISNNNYLWQEFVIGDPRKVFFAQLYLNNSLSQQENVRIEITDNTDAVIAVSNWVPTSAIQSGGNWVDFNFSGPVSIVKGSKYKMYLVRSGWSLFPWEQVWWGIEYSDLYTRGTSSHSSNSDLKFRTLTNGEWDQTQQQHSGFEGTGSSRQYTAWQEFVTKW